MLIRLIEFSLRHRLLVGGGALLLLAYGTFAAIRLPVDVFPELDRPTVTIMTEAHGMAPQEVEQLVTWPIETFMNGAPGVNRVRSTSAIGLSIVYVEFGWDMEIYRARQLVQERLQQAAESLPADVHPAMMPISSIMGEILHIGLRSRSENISPMELRSLADWQVRPRLLSVPGVAHVSNIGGGVRQVQIRPHPHLMAMYGVALAEIVEAARLTQMNTGGGFLEGDFEEILIRHIGRTADLDEIAGSIVAVRAGLPVTLRDVAEVGYGRAIMRGDAGINGEPGVVVSVQKQPGVNTVLLTAEVKAAIEELRTLLPEAVELTILFEQSDFIEVAVANVLRAIRDGGILLVAVLVIFLLSVRVTLITLTAIPLSFMTAAVVFQLMDVTINTMTLGGLAVAIGMLVDDAIVTTENVFRRLRENHFAAAPRPLLRVIASAVGEVLQPVILSTLLILLVFIPLLGLSGIEGRMFLPVALAVAVAMISSTLVALTVVPVLASYLLPGGKRLRARQESALVRVLKAAHERLILSWTLRFPLAVVGIALLLATGAMAFFPRMGTQFLPEFNEGSFNALLVQRPGTSLAESNRIGSTAERLLLEIPEVVSTGRRTGRAELDDHAEGTHFSEIEVNLGRGGRSREIVRAEIREALSQIPGTALNVDQPISHRLDHMMAGVEAQIAVKIFGHDLAGLRQAASDVERVMAGVPGVVDLNIEPQVLIRQVTVVPNRTAMREYGLRAGEINELLETAFRGRAVAQVIDGNRTEEIYVRYAEGAFRNLEALSGTLIDVGNGLRIPLAHLATVRESRGPNMINRENVQRRIIVSANVAGRDLGSVVREAHERVQREVVLPEGSFVRFEGQFQAQQEATRMIGLLGLLTLFIIALVLYSQFRSMVIVGHLLLVIPIAFSGGILATWLTGGVVSVATLVGLITLAGIATRNTLLMLTHYFHLVRHEGETLDDAMIVRGSLERLIPMSMTVLTTGLALVPIAMAAGEPGREILYPIAIVVIGGLVTAMLADLFFTPAFFKRFGLSAAEKYLHHHSLDPLDVIPAGMAATTENQNHHQPNEQT
jgi:CzcA family heavy metal efflux pump